MRVDLQGGSVEFKARESVLSKIEASLQPGFEPVQPKYAATVMLVRDSAPFQTEYRIESDHFPPDFPTGQELEVFMLRRVKTMEFVPDAVVFPGGRVESYRGADQLIFLGSLNKIPHAHLARGKPSEKGYAWISVRNPSAMRFRGYFVAKQAKLRKIRP